MKIFVAGATGALSRPLLTQLIVKGHNVVALTRSPEKALTLTKQGVEVAIADVFDQKAVKAAVIRTQPEVVIEQLTSLPKTYTCESMSAAAALNTHIRQEGGAIALAAAQSAGVRRYFGSWLLLGSMAGAILFGIYNHFIVIRPDHVSHVSFVG